MVRVTTVPAAFAQAVSFSSPSLNVIAVTTPADSRYHLPFRPVVWAAQHGMAITGAGAGWVTTAAAGHGCGPCPSWMRNWSCRGSSGGSVRQPVGRGAGAVVGGRVQPTTGPVT